MAALECPICYEEITCDSGVTKLACSHSFHLKCIVTWILKSETCPCCRKDVCNNEKLSGLIYRPRTLSYEGNVTTFADFPVDIFVPNLRLPPRIERIPYGNLNPEAPEFIPQSN